MIGYFGKVGMRYFHKQQAYVTPSPHPEKITSNICAATSGSPSSTWTSSGPSSPLRSARSTSPARATRSPSSTSSPSATPRSSARAASPRSPLSSRLAGSPSWPRRRSPRPVVSLSSSHKFSQIQIIPTLRRMMCSTLWGVKLQ